MPSRKINTTTLTPQEIETDLIFKAVSDFNRRAILNLVAQSPDITLTELCTHFEMTRFAVMKHINVLIDAKLLHARADGKFKRYTLHFDPLAKNLTDWLTQLEKQNQKNLRPIG